jgi:mono/diheme cytochrome c family protein
MSLRAPIDARPGLPAWAIGITVFVLLVGGVYAASNLVGENPAARVPGASAPPPPATDDPIALGQRLVGQATPTCQTCHGQNWEGGAGPELTRIDEEGPRSENLQALAEEHPDDWIALWIDGTGEEVQGLDRLGMPAFGDQFSPEEIEAIAAFLKSLD